MSKRILTSYTSVLTTKFKTHKNKKQYGKLKKHMHTHSHVHNYKHSILYAKDKTSDIPSSKGT